MGFVYRLTFPSGKVYVGQTVGDVEKRWRRHLWQANSSDQAHHVVHLAILKYGWDNVVKEVLSEVPDDLLDEEEKRQIDLHDCITPKGYNMRAGGRIGSICSDEARKKMREAFTPELRNSLSKKRSKFILHNHDKIRQSSQSAWDGRDVAARERHRSATSIGFSMAKQARTQEEDEHVFENRSQAQQLKYSSMNESERTAFHESSWSVAAREKRHQTMLKAREAKLSKLPPEQREKQQKLWERKERERHARTGSTMKKAAHRVLGKQLADSPATSSYSSLKPSDDEMD